MDDPEIPDTGTRSFKIIARLKVQRKLSALTALTKDWAKILKRPEVGIYKRKKLKKKENTLSTKKATKKKRKNDYC